MEAGKIWAWLAASCLVLSACATSSIEALVPGSITIEQMRTQQKPSAEWKNADGSVTLEYSGRPGKDKNMMLDFDAKGVFKEARSVVTFDNMALIKLAMTREDVRRVFGSPNYVSINHLTGGEIWEWSLGSQPPGTAVPVVIVHWHPTADGVVKVTKGARFE